MACGIATYAWYCYDCDRAVHKIPYKAKHHRTMIRGGDGIPLRYEEKL